MRTARFPSPSLYLGRSWLLLTRNSVSYVLPADEKTIKLRNFIITVYKPWGPSAFKSCPESWSKPADPALPWPLLLECVDSELEAFSMTYTLFPHGWGCGWSFWGWLPLVMTMETHIHVSMWMCVWVCELLITCKDTLQADWSQN